MLHEEQFTYSYMLAVVETLFFYPKNVGFLNSKLGQAADTNITDCNLTLIYIKIYH